jgi:hypothetical protein
MITRKGIMKTRKKVEGFKETIARKGTTKIKNENYYHAKGQTRP